MDNFGRIAIFIEVSKQQSFSKAAKKLGITGPAASKQITNLEKKLGIKLLNRTTRVVTLTDEGQLFYEKARFALEEIKNAAEQIQEAKLKPQGVLKINSPHSFGNMHLLPIISGFAKKYPEVNIEVTFDDRIVDVITEGYDLVIRIAPMLDSSLISKALMDCPIYLVATKEYIKKFGMPQKPKDLKNHKIIAYTNQGEFSEWRYKDINGKVGSVKCYGAFRSNTAEMMLQATLDGLGIAILPIFAISSYLQSKQLVRILPEYETYPLRKISAIMPANRYRSAKVKLFLEWLTKACKTIQIKR
jgi:DNA-binding transcriptional LysR family regulator